MPECLGTPEVRPVACAVQQGFHQRMLCRRKKTEANPFASKADLRDELESLENLRSRSRSGRAQNGENRVPYETKEGRTKFTSAPVDAGRSFQAAFYGF